MQGGRRDLRYTDLVVLLMALLLLQSDSAQEIDELIRRLNSDVLEERDDAMTRLKEIGPPAIPTLEKTAKFGEAEARGRARLILDHISRLERLRALRPSDRRVSVDLRDAPLKEVLGKVLEPLGLTGVTLHEKLAAKTLTLKLEKTPIWESVERLEEAAGVRLDLSSGVLRPAAGDEKPRRWSGTGEIRVEVPSWGSYRSGAAAARKSLSLKTWLPPGSWAGSSDFQDVQVTDEAGKGLKVETEWVVHMAECRRNEGLPSAADSGVVVIPPEGLKGVKTISLKGTMVLNFPRDVERLEIPRIPGKVAVMEGIVSLDTLTKDDRWGWTVQTGGTGARETYTVLMSIEDAAGRWLGDLHTMTIEPNSSRGTGTSVRLKDGVPARCIVTRMIGQESVRVPFTLSIPGPDQD